MLHMAPRRLSQDALFKRLSTLERQLQRYVATPLPPPAHAYQAQRRATLRRRVLRDLLRRQRALRTNGHEQGWLAMPLTADDEERVTRLLAQFRDTEL